MKVKSESEVAQSCSTLSDPMDCSLPGSSVHGIFQARVLEWGAIAFSGFIYSAVYFLSLLVFMHHRCHCIWGLVKKHTQAVKIILFYNTTLLSVYIWILKPSE